MTLTKTPAIVLAAEEPTFVGAALQYARLGLSVIPVRGKKPAVPTWRARMKSPATANLIRWWQEDGRLDGIGIVCGAVSGNLVVIDLDGLDAYGLFIGAFPDLADTYTVRSGSQRGYHLYYHAHELPATTRAVGLEAGNVELRADGCYVVAPPSVHEGSGKPYRVARALPVRVLPDMRQVAAWIDGLNEARRPRVQTETSPAGVVHAAPWALAALRYEADAVERASEGGANNRLNLAAFKLGQIVADGKIGRGDVEAALREAAAALAARDGEASVERTIRSGLDAGMRCPRGGRG